jgi:hypothetical protein
MSIEKYSQFISVHEQKTRTIGLRSTVVSEADYPLPYKSAEERHGNVMAHAKKMGYNVHYNEHFGDERSGNKGNPDVTVHYERGDKRGDIPASIEVHKGSKAHGDKALHAMIKGKASAMK